MAVSEGTLFALGNPLLDIAAHVDPEFLQQYDLVPNNAILAEDKHKTIYADLVGKYKVEYVPGGATLNSIRIVQWLINTPKVTTFMGCIGKDNYGDILTEKAKSEGVNVQYQINDEEPTGTSAVLIIDEDNSRSLVAYLAAANCFTKDHIELPENVKLMNKAQYYYISGFPLTVCPPAMMKVASHACENDKLFSFNLSAPFLCQFFKEPMMQLMPYVDILFGNETEAATFAKEHEFGTEDIKEIALKVAALEKKNSKRSRMVVFTQGSLPAVIAKDGKVTEYPVTEISEDDILDTCGAGDAYVGGFLAQLIQGKSVDECVRCANYAANLIIQRSGCTFPEKHDYQ